MHCQKYAQNNLADMISKCILGMKSTPAAVHIFLLDAAINPAILTFEACLFTTNLAETS